jgi:hypothetical protein
MVRVAGPIAITAMASHIPSKNSRIWISPVLDSREWMAPSRKGVAEAILTNIAGRISPFAPLASISAEFEPRAGPPIPQYSAQAVLFGRFC